MHGMRSKQQPVLELIPGGPTAKRNELGGGFKLAPYKNLNSGPKHLPRKEMENTFPALLPSSISTRAEKVCFRNTAVQGASSNWQQKKKPFHVLSREPHVFLGGLPSQH